nr:MAG TPA: hypothetical protein [Caudoviricetes sp.]
MSHFLQMLQLQMLVSIMLQVFRRLMRHLSILGHIRSTIALIIKV